mgnify:CR=1 FL=1|jgi:hypothetical protein
MLFRSAAVIAIFASSAQAATGIYDYDQVSLWNNDFAAPNGECDGRKQSPIAFETMECSVYANYEMNVSCLQLSLTTLPSTSPRQSLIRRYGVGVVACNTLQDLYVGSNLFDPTKYYIFSKEIVLWMTWISSSTRTEFR